MPSPQGLDGRILNTGHCCSGSCSDPEAMAGILMLWSPNAAEDGAKLFHKPGLTNCLSVWVQKEGPLPVSPEHEVLANGRDWAQLVSRDPYDHIGT